MVFLRAAAALSGFQSARSREHENQSVRAPFLRLSSSRTLKLIVALPVALALFLSISSPNVSFAIDDADKNADNLFNKLNELTKSDLDAQRKMLEQLKLLGRDTHMLKPDKCEFENPQDLVNKVNQKSLEDAQKRGINLDTRGGGPNGRNDALEGRFWAVRNNKNGLGAYACSEFSAYLQCILQTLFDCTEDQVQSIADRTHMINRVNTNIFKNYQGPSYNGGKWVNIEPQSFFRGNAGITGSGGLRGGVREFYPKPHPYRAGVNNTNYDELQCKSGPGYTGDGAGADGGGLFGGGSSSAMLSSMIGAMMGRMGQQNGGAGGLGAGTSPGTAGSQQPLVSPALMNTLIPTPTPTVVGTAGAKGTVTPSPTKDPSETATPDGTTTPSGTADDATKAAEKAAADLLSDIALDEFFDRKVAEDNLPAVEDGVQLFADDVQVRASDSEVAALPPKPTASPYTF